MRIRIPDREQTAFLEILSDHLHGRRSRRQELDWRKLWQYAFTHQVSAIIYDQCAEWMGQKELFEEAYHAATYQSLQYRFLDGRLRQKFSEAGIEVFTVKGLAVADCYPKPLLRTMGDLDLVTNRRKEAGEVLSLLGFALKPELRDDWEWHYRKDGLLVELHDMLLYQSDEISDCQRDFFNHYQPFLNQGKLEWNFHFLYLICHMYRHFLKSGVGFRHFMDLAAVILTVRLDENWLSEQLKKLGMYRFTLTVLSLIEIWFDVPSPLRKETDTAFGHAAGEAAESSSEDVEVRDKTAIWGRNDDSEEDRGVRLLSEDFVKRATLKIFRDGLFGLENKENDDNEITLSAARGKLPPSILLALRVVKTVFLPYSRLQHLKGFEFLKGRPYLLPAAWVRRLVLRLVYGDAARFMSRAFPEKEAIEERKRQLDEWGL
ncbi:MAG: nucleotidyltransferase family protein [Blautia sp.]|nr:nucleotidyltransferase family protein [Blautia sp.]